MWERFTELAKQVVSSSSEHACRLGSNQVESQHVLLALCSVKQSLAARTLENLGVDAEALAAELVRQNQLGSPISGTKPLFTACAKKVLETAVSEARSLNDGNHGYIGTEHILLGMMTAPANHPKRSPLMKIMDRILGGVGDNGGCSARQRLLEMTTYGEIRAEVVRILGESKRPVWHRFTDHAKQVVSAAGEHACRLGSNRVESQHLLLALCSVKKSLAARTLGNLGVDTEALAAELERQNQLGPPISGVPALVSARAKELLEMAVVEARNLNHSYIGTEHILLGMMTAPKWRSPMATPDRDLGDGDDIGGCSARQRLLEMTTCSEIRAEVLRLLSRPNGEPT